MTREELLALAREVALRAYCPYSHFRVGTALVASGQLYTGVNIEISSYGLSLCAERSDRPTSSNAMAALRLRCAAPSRVNNRGNSTFFRADSIGSRL